MTKKKFLHTLIARSIPPNIVSCLEEQPARSGMYNWLFVFGGEIKTYWELTDDDLAKYDIIQVNMSPKDMPIIPELRRRLKNSSTKLVINNDYVCEYWGKWNIDPWYYRQVQMMGDMVFGTEPYQVSNMINGSFVIPHPTNTNALKHLGTDQCHDSVGLIFHWWAGMSFLGWNTLSRLKEANLFKKISAFGYDKNWDECKAWSQTMFDDIVPLMKFPDFAQRIQGERCLYDPNPYHTYGRNGVELACFRKPIVGSNRVFSYRKLFEGLTIDPMDGKQAQDKIKKVLSGCSRVDDMLDQAYNDVEYFNYANSKARFLKAFDESIDRGGYEWHQKNL